MRIRINNFALEQRKYLRAPNKNLPHCDPCSVLRDIFTPEVCSSEQSSLLQGGALKQKTSDDRKHITDTCSTVAIFRSWPGSYTLSRDPIVNAALYASTHPLSLKGPTISCDVEHVCPLTWPDSNARCSKMHQPARHYTPPQAKKPLHFR